MLCLHYRPETVHCSTKNAYTSKITFLALLPWPYTNKMNVNMTQTDWIGGMFAKFESVSELGSAC